MNKRTPRVCWERAERSKRPTTSLPGLTATSTTSLGSVARVVILSYGGARAHGTNAKEEVWHAVEAPAPRTPRTRTRRRLSTGPSRATTPLHPLHPTQSHTTTTTPTQSRCCWRTAPTSTHMTRASEHRSSWPHPTTKSIQPNANYQPYCSNKHTLPTQLPNRLSRVLLVHGADVNAENDFVLAP
jgi:hypothetical protein